MRAVRAPARAAAALASAPACPPPITITSKGLVGGVVSAKGWNELLDHTNLESDSTVAKVLRRTIGAPFQRPGRRNGLPRPLGSHNLVIISGG